MHHPAMTQTSFIRSTGEWWASGSFTTRHLETRVHPVATFCGFGASSEGFANEIEYPDWLLLHSSRASGAFRRPISDPSLPAGIQIQDVGKERLGNPG
ncbi:hypothetical protein TRAPUB_9037 [Trametes pubescens]|uniref:Uncharacterized protein n=1 Tax=Trametes pubescens TaxID=154538 RepID=A0A1M2W3L1_TRAPU|nr:hypothetical protein TRAPUB_9037 [Trametes pubescens]